MLYFSPLSVTDDKQRDRKHPFSFPQCRQGRWVGGWVGGGGRDGSQSQGRQDSDGGRKHRTNVYVACSGGVVVVDYLVNRPTAVL